MPKKNTIVEHLAHVVPSLNWLDNYSVSSLRSDLAVSLLLAALLIPQAVAYSQLAGLDPRAGLSAALLPALFYAIYGSSRYLNVGPVALISLLTASTVGWATAFGEQSALVMAGLLAVSIGLIQLVIGVARLGFITNFISEPAVTGFMNGAAILILFSQLPSLLGLEIDTRSVIDVSMAIAYQAEDIQLQVLAGGGLALAAFLGLPPIVNKTVTLLSSSKSLGKLVEQLTPLLIIIMAMLVNWQLRQHTSIQLPVVGAVASGAPDFSLPPLDYGLWWIVFYDAVAIALLGYVLALGAANSLAGSNRQRIHPDREAIAVGFGNIGSGLSGGFPVGASLSRSAVASSAGASSPVAGLGAALLVLLILISGGPFFAYLPSSTLAALIISAVVGMLDPQRMWFFIKFDKGESAAVLVSFSATIFLGARFGIGMGAAVSLLAFLWHSSHPSIVVEGTEGKSGRMKNKKRDDVDEVDDEVIVIRIDEGLYFGNSRYCEQEILRLISERTQIQCIVLDLKSVGRIDASSVLMLKRIKSTASSSNMKLVLAHARGEVYECLDDMGLIDEFDGYYKSAKAAKEKEKS